MRKGKNRTGNNKIAQKFNEKLSEPFYSSIPKVTRNKNKKTVSVAHFFDVGHIPIKIIAKYDEWIKLEKNVLDNNWHIGFGRIESLIRTSKPNAEALKKYSLEFPDIFGPELFDNFIEPSKDENPLCTPKTRGLSDELSRKKREEAKATAQHLYVYLTYWLKKFKKQPNECPDDFKQSLKRIKHECGGNNPGEQALECTRLLIEKQYRLTMRETKHFYYRYILRTNLNHLKAAYRKKDYRPWHPLLRKILPLLP